MYSAPLHFLFCLRSLSLGVSDPRYSAEELRRFEEQDKRLYKIGNIEKDGYGWSQSMRAIEADIRKSKDEINALSALGGNEAKIKELKSRIKTFQSKYDEISDVTVNLRFSFAMPVTSEISSYLL